MKGFILKPHEAQALAAGKPVVIWRACKVQPVMHRWEHESANPPFHDAMGFVGKEICAPGYLAIGVDRAMESAGYLRIPFPVGVPLFGKETWCEGEGPIFRAEWDRFYEPNELRGMWKPSTTMPERIARVCLTLSDVKVRRPCDVTEEEAKAMGFNSRSTGKCLLTIIQSFCEQWSLAYGDTAIAWNSYHFTALATPQPKEA